MNLTIWNAREPRDRERWLERHSSWTGREVFAHPDYVSLFAREQDTPIAIYAEDSVKFLQDASTSLAAGNSIALYEAAHSLKGMLGVYTASRASETASHLCHLAQDGDFFGARALLEKLKKECARLGTSLASLELPG